MSYRWIEESDRDLLKQSLNKDEYHKNTTVDFFYDPSSVCSVQEDEQGTVFFLRAAKELRLDIQYVSNADRERNAKAMLERLPSMVEQAKAAGFSALIFNTSSPLLKRFCIRKLGFVEVEGEDLRKFL